MMRALLVSVLALGPVATAPAQASGPFDLVLRGGTVVDGTGAPPFRADVAIRGTRIAAVGDLRGLPARESLDAEGLVIAPGFLDVHAHADTGTERRPTADNFLLMGVTTIVTGNCGRSVRDLDGHFARLDKGGVSLNYASLVGHGTVREAVMGRANRPPTAEELARMEELVDDAMAAGAVGMSTGLIYVPGTYAETEELIALARVVARHGGLYASHMRNEAGGVIEAIEEALRIGREADLPVHLSHLKASGKPNWGRSAEILVTLRGARADGLRVTGDQYAYDASSTSMDVLFPSEALSVGRAEFARLLAEDADFRARMGAALDLTVEGAGFGDLSYARIADAPNNQDLNGMTLKEAAAKRYGEDDAEAQARLALELMTEAKGRRIGMVYHKMAMADVVALMAEPWIAVAADSGIRSFSGPDKPHPRGCGNNPRVLGLFVRELQALDLETAIHKMTALPARTFGIEDRGTVRPGAFADLTVFDPDAVADRATWQEPKLPPAGIPRVIVNGTVVVEQGRHTRARPGMVLRHGRPAEDAR